MGEKVSGYMKPRIRFVAVELFFWCAMSVTMFVVVYLNELGVSSSVIGLILGANALISMVAQPFWGWVSDRMGSAKRALMLCLGASGTCYLLLFFAKPVLLIAAILMADMFFRSAAGSLLDLWIVSTYAGENRIGYGSVRLWGSVGFAVAIFFFGRVADIRTASILFPFYSLSMALAILLCIPIRGNTLPARQAGMGRLGMGGLFRSYPYVTFLLFVFLLNIPNSPFYSFLPTLVQSVGGTKAQYGLMQSVKALTEVPFFLLGKRLLDRFGPVRLMMFSASVYLVQAAAYALSRNVLQVSLALLLSGPAFSLFSVGMLHYIYAMAPDGRKAVAQTVTGMVSMNVSAIFGNTGGGMLIDRFSLRSLYWAGSVFIAVSLAFFALSVSVRKKTVKEKTEMGCLQ